MLSNSGKRNWTIVRPGITMNANHIGWGNWWDYAWVGRIIRGRKVAVEKEMLDFKFSLSSGAQVAALIGSVIGNSKAMGEVFNVCSSEVWSWREMLERYRRIFAKHGYELKEKYVNSKDVIGKSATREYWYKRARLLDRVFDNTKIRTIIPVQKPEKSMSELLEEWTDAYIRNYETHKLDGMQVGQTAEIDRLTGDSSPHRDFCSSRLYIKYLLMRYCPRVLALYSRANWLPRSALRCICGR